MLRTGQEVSIYDLKKKPSLSVPLGREILVPLELVVSRHYNPIINYKVGRSTMRTIVVVVLGSRDDIFTSISQKMSRNEVTEKTQLVALHPGSRD